jgi:hypothetical protein
MSQSVLKVVAGVAALAAIAFGASAIASGSKSNTNPVAGAGAAQGMPGTPPRGLNGATPPSGANGGPPQGGPGFGTPVTGATATKVKAAALAKYPGTVERVMQLADGSYVVHVFGSGGSEVHVLVNKQFQVTGTATGPPGRPAPGAPAAGKSASGSTT